MRKAISGLLPGTKYVIQVRGRRDDGTLTAFSPAFRLTTTTDTDLPKTPGNVTWNVSGDAFYAEWDSVTRNVVERTSAIVRYELEFERNSAIKIISVPQTTDARLSYTLSFEQNRALFNGTPQPVLRFRVRAVDNKNLKSEWSAPITATNPAPGPPTAPAVGAVATAATDAIMLAWTPPGDEDLIGFVVYTGSTAGFTPSNANKIYSGMGTRFIYATTTYAIQYFKIRAVDKFGQESVDLTGSATPRSSFVVDVTAPDTPTGLSATLVNNPTGVGAQATVSWTMSNPPSDLAGFYVQYRKSGDSEFYTANFDNSARSGNIDLREAYSAYQFRIKAYDWSNNESAWSSLVTASAQANAAPANVTGFTSNAARDGIRYNWTQVADTDVKEYEITFSTSSTFASGNTTFRTGGNVLTVSGLTPATNYYARIRAVDVGGLTSPSWSATNTTQTLSASAVTSVSDLTGGTISNTDWILGPSANFIINGGNIRSNTYTGTSQASNPSGAGFYLGNDGLRIDTGQIKANALVSDTLTSTIITLGAGGEIKGGSWTLNSSGLTIPDGVIAASKLNLQVGQNLLPAVYSDFEINSTEGLFFTSGMLIGINNTPKFNNQSLGTLWGTSSSSPYVMFAPTNETYNVPVTEGDTYIVSGYVWCMGSVPTQVSLNVKYSNGVMASVASTASPLPAGGNPQSAVRLSGTITIPSGVTGLLLYAASSTLTNGGGFNIDGLQIERKTSSVNTPSPWSPGSTTQISGGQIRTGEMRSNQNVTVNGIQQPAWSINLNGAAQFGDAFVRGKIVVGPAGGTDAGQSFINSGNYVAGSAGWKISSDGVGEFANLISRSANGTKTEITNVDNAFGLGQSWNILSMYPNASGAAWSPAQIWANHGGGGTVANPNFGDLHLFSPKLGAADPAKVELTYAQQTNDTTIRLTANKMYSTANNFWWGDPNSNIVSFRLSYNVPNGAQGYRIYSSGGAMIGLDFSGVGENSINSRDSNFNYERLDLNFESLMLNPSTAATGKLEVMGWNNADISGNNPGIWHQGNTGGGLAFLSSGALRVVNRFGTAYAPIGASSFPINSDMREKTNESIVAPVLNDMMKIKVYDYNTPHGIGRKLEDPAPENGFRQRGLMAQDIQKFWPDAVTEDERGMLSVDTYFLIGTIWAGAQEQKISHDKEVGALRSELEAMRRELASLKR